MCKLFFILLFSLLSSLSAQIILSETENVLNADNEILEESNKEKKRYHHPVRKRKYSVVKIKNRVITRAQFSKSKMIKREQTASTNRAFESGENGSFMKKKEARKGVATKVNYNLQ